MPWIQRQAVALNWLFLLGVPLALAWACLWGNPFSHVLGTTSLSLQTLSPEQKSNLMVALRPVDGQVIEPGEVFSFNRTVGPRTASRGYLPAPSYLGGASPNTIGGGICLLSSALYQLALKSNLRIIQRVPHLRTIHSVPPGLDATVWYGGPDLQFKNSLNSPVRLTVTRQGNTLSVALTGKKKHPPQPIHRTVSRRSNQGLLVTVFQNQRMISRDWYRISP
jgi:vancomycin resistance protein YoaR